MAKKAFRYRDGSKSGTVIQSALGPLETMKLVMSRIKRLEVTVYFIHNEHIVPVPGKWQLNSSAAKRASLSSIATHQTERHFI